MYFNVNKVHNEYNMRYDFLFLDLRTIMAMLICEMIYVIKICFDCELEGIIY